MSSRFRVTGPSAFPSYRQSPGQEPQVVDEGDLRSLRFSANATESAMSRADPAALVLGYTRTMMGFLLFDEQPGRIGMIGLGGGSIAKYCRHHLPASRFIAVESDPRVVALRDSFGIPPDDAMFQVVEANGEDWVHDTRSPRWRG
jgi:spermidine synthase